MMKTKKPFFSAKNLTVTPYAVWMVLFVLIPIGLVVYFAFTDANGTFTLENLSYIKRYAETFWLSVELALISTVICLLLAYPMAFIIAKMPTERQGSAILLIMLPMWMNFLIRTYAWMTILENNGIINRFVGMIAQWLQIEFEGFSMINTNGAIVLGMVYNYLPYMILPIYTVLTKIDNSLIEAARDLGSSSVHVFRRIIAPLSVPGVISGITMVFVPAVSTFIISYLLGGGKTYLIGNIIENYFLGSSGAINYNVGAALSLLLMILIVVSMGIMNHFDKDSESVGGGMIV
ncbi:MAG: ABC transporter permease [Clostridia bacterium]|nr:ABC transporter permease [Clostridia bacterium]